MEAILKSLIPATFAIGRGEQPLSERISAYIEQSRQMIYAEIVPESLCTEEIFKGIGTPEAYDILRRTIAAGALYLAVPSLDVTLTSTGFAVSSTDTLAPASKARVEELRKSLLLTRDEGINLLITQYLPGIPGWEESRPGSQIAACILTMEETSLAIGRQCYYQLWRAYRGYVYMEQHTVCALRYLSQKVIDRLRLRCTYLALHPQLKQLYAERHPECLQQETIEIDWIADIVKEFLSSKVAEMAAESGINYSEDAKSYKHPTKLKIQNPTTDLRLKQAAQYLLEHADLYPEILDTEYIRICRRRNRFQNTKKSGGYFF